MRGLPAPATVPPLHKVGFPMHILAQLQRLFTLICRTAIGVMFFTLIAVVMLQVITRTFGLSSPVWTEELSRYLLLYMTAFGIGIALMTGDLVNVDLLQEVVPEHAAWWMRLSAVVGTAIMGFVMIEPAWRFTLIGKFQLSPALRIPMSWIHASVCVLGVALFAFATLRVIGMLAGTDNGRPQPLEDNE